VSILPTANNRKIAQTITAVARAQTLSPGFSVERALELTRRLEQGLDQARTDEATFALCALLMKGMGVSHPRELADLLRP
jgi:hypothetical protein